MAGSQPLSESGAVDHPLVRLLPAPAKRTIVILSLALASCQPATPVSPTADVVTLRFLADNAASPLLHELASAYHPANQILTWDIQVAETQVVLDLISTPGAPYALIDYLPGLPGQLWMTPVGQDGVAFIVHPSNAVASLSASQLRSILQGRVPNWSSVDGPALDLHVVVSSSQDSASALVQSMVLGDRRLTRTARLAPTSQAVIEIVASDPGAIGYIPMGYLSPVVRAVPLDGIAISPETVAAQRYPLTTPLVFAGTAEPVDNAYRAFFVWVQSPAGQAVVRKHFGPISSQ